MPPDASKSNIRNPDAAAKGAGFRNFNNFLQSYGLRIWNDDDIQEGKGILRAMGYGV